MTLERPKNREHGDWASNVAMKLGKRIGVNPRDFAAELAELLAATPGVAATEVAGPGFLNITLDAAAAGELARRIVEEGDAYGRGELYRGVTINLEFVSANPTGPLHIGGVALGGRRRQPRAPASSPQGGLVTREYYFNDHGSQIDRFARSLVAAHRGEPAPEDGYGGAYIPEIAARVECRLPRRPRRAAARGAAGGLPRARRQPDVRRDQGEPARLRRRLRRVLPRELRARVGCRRARDRAAARSSATSTRPTARSGCSTTEFGDDKDRVIIKSDGEPAYISGDLAYYLNKRERGFERSIILLGADHHGYVERLMAMTAAFGDVPYVNLEILIGQLVNLVQRRRAGADVEARGHGRHDGGPGRTRSASTPPATRSCAARCDSQLDIDLDLLGKRTNDNPVFYVQYAHARTRAVARNAEAAGVDRSRLRRRAAAARDRERAARRARRSSRASSLQATELREPHRVARYLEQLAGSYHRWYDNCRVIPLGDAPVEDVHRTRLWLNEATGQVLRNGLNLHRRRRAGADVADDDPDAPDTARPATAHPDAAHGWGERRRPLWPWITLGVLLVAARGAPSSSSTAFARGVARDEIATRVTSALGLPAGTPVEVEVGGASVLIQLATGSFESVDLSIPDATFGRLTGDLEVHAEGIPLDPDAPTSLVEVRYAMPESEVAEFREELSGLPLDSITLDDPEIVTSTTFRLFGIPVSRRDGPRALRRRGAAHLHADDDHRAGSAVLRRQPAVRARLRAPGHASCSSSSRSASRPSSRPALVLDRIGVEGDELVAHFSAQDAALGSSRRRAPAQPPLVEEPTEWASRTRVFATMDPASGTKPGSLASQPFPTYSVRFS